MIVRLSDATGGIRFESEPDGLGNYPPNAIDITIPAGQAYYVIGRDTSVPNDPAKDTMSFFRQDGSFICGGQLGYFANVVGTVYTSFADIIQDIQPFFFELATIPPGFVEVAPPGMIFVAPSGNDSNPGTMQSPRLNINQALTDVAANGMVVCLPGTYTQFVTAVNNKTLRLEPGANFTYVMDSNRHWFSDNGVNLTFNISATRGANRVSVTALTAQTIGSGIHVGGNSTIHVRGLEVVFSSVSLQAPLMTVAGASVNITIEECVFNTVSGGTHVVRFDGTALASFTRFQECTLQNAITSSVVRVAGGHSPQFRGTRIYKVFGTLCIDAPAAGQSFDCYLLWSNRAYDTTNLSVRVAPSMFVNSANVRP